VNPPPHKKKTGGLEDSQAHILGRFNSQMVADGVDEHINGECILLYLLFLGLRRREGIKDRIKDRTKVSYRTGKVLV